jgi:hypothetical protein
MPRGEAPEEYDYGEKQEVNRVICCLQTALSAVVGPLPWKI